MIIVFNDDLAQGEAKNEENIDVKLLALEVSLNSFKDSNLA